MHTALKSKLDSALEAALTFTLEEEGGWSDHPADRGGATKYGITLETYRRRHPGASAEDLRGMTMEEARTIYREDYWPWDSLAPKFGDALLAIDSRVLIKVFDMGVNMGVRQAGKLLQRAANRVMRDIIPEDGIIGPSTLWLTMACDQPRLLAALCEVQEEFYNKLVERDASQRVFIKGWTKRARRIPA